MIKAWLLITMISVQGWPSVKTTSEVHFSEPACEARRIHNENMLTDIALEQGIESIWVETWCHETHMFIPLKT